MQNREVKLEQLLRKLNPFIHSLFTRALIEIPQIIPSSERERVEHWLDAKPFLSVGDIKEGEEEKFIDPITPHIFSRDALAIFHFYQCTQVSYQPQVPYLSRCLLPESKETNALSHSIKTGHLIFEAAQVLFLLIKHTQFLLILQESYACLSPEKKHMFFMVDILWYQSAVWILIHFVAIAYFIKVLLSEKHHIQHLINFIQDNKNITHKIKSFLLAQHDEMTPSDANEKFLLVSSMISSLSIKENKKNRDWLSWVDDICHLVLPDTRNRKDDSMERLKQIYHLASTMQSHLNFWIAHYLAENIVTIGLMTLLMQTILSPKNYILDMMDISSNELSYSFLPWICRQYYPYHSHDFSSIAWTIPIFYYLELQLLAWLLVPLIAGIVDISIITKTINNDAFSSKEKFRKKLIDNMQVMRGHLIFKADVIDDFIPPEEEAKKIYLIDNILAEIQFNFQKPSDSLDMTGFLRRALYELSRTVCQLLKIVYSVSADFTVVSLIFIIDNLPKDRFTRIHNAASIWKKNYCDRLSQSKVSDADASFFSSKKTKTNPKILLPASSFRPRMHFH